MINAIKKALSVPLTTIEDIIHFEAKIGGRLFGAIPEKHRREFFCLDEQTWVWHEEWPDKFGRRQSLTTRYDVRPNGIYKTSGNGAYHKVGFEELSNLHQASQMYCQKVMPELQRLAEKT